MVKGLWAPALPPFPPSPPRPAQACLVTLLEPVALDKTVSYLGCFQVSLKWHLTVPPTLLRAFQPFVSLLFPHQPRELSVIHLNCFMVFLSYFPHHLSACPVTSLFPWLDLFALFLTLSYFWGLKTRFLDAQLAFCGALAASGMTGDQDMSLLPGVWPGVVLALPSLASSTVVSVRISARPHWAS